MPTTAFFDAEILSEDEGESDKKEVPLLIDLWRERVLSTRDLLDLLEIENDLID